MTDRATRGAWWQRLLGEPLLHFALLGGGLFALYANVAERPLPADPRHIVIDEKQVDRLTRPFERTWLRPATPQEIEGLVADYVKEEILYREARALGLDDNDLIIRRRLRQKMEFLNQDLTAPPAPTDTELQAYLDGNATRYRDPDLFSFRQVFFKIDDPTAADRAMRLLNELALPATRTPAMDELGDPSLLPVSMQNVTDREIAAGFGDELADSISKAPIGTWSGPYRSTFGLHLVELTAHESAEAPTLMAKRASVSRDWRNDQRRAADQRLYQAMLDRYTVERRYVTQTVVRTAETQVATR